MKNNMTFLLRAGWKVQVQVASTDHFSTSYIAMLICPYVEQFIPQMISLSAYSWVPSQLGATPQAAVELLKLKIDRLEEESLGAKIMSACGLMFSPAGPLSGTQAKLALGALGFDHDLPLFGIYVDEKYTLIPCDFYPHITHVDNPHIGEYTLISKHSRDLNVSHLPSGLGIPGMLESHATFGIFPQDMTNGAIHDLIRNWTPSPEFDNLIVSLGENRTEIKDLQPILAAMRKRDSIIICECGELIAHSILPDTRFVEVQLNLQLGKQT